MEKSLSSRSYASARTAVGDEGQDDSELAGQDSAPGATAVATRATGTVDPVESLSAGVDLRPGATGLRVLLAVPTRGYVWHETAKALEKHNPQYVREKLSVSNARNKIVRDFLKTDADVLVMCDDDVIPAPDFLERLIESPYDIVGAAVPIAKMPAHPVFINAFTVYDDGRIVTCELPEKGHLKVDSIGSGLILIHRKVLEDKRMTRPFDQQINQDGVILVGQDLEFCRRARSFGFSIGVSVDALCDHYVSLHANAVALAYQPELAIKE